MSNAHQWSACVIAFLLLSCILPTRAHCQNAEDLFHEGVDQFSSGDYTNAAKSFRAAYDAKPSWKILFNIGHSEAAAKQYDLALEAFEAYLAQGGDDIPVDRREEVLAEVTRLRQMVGSIEVKAPENAIIFIDEIERGTAPIVGKITVSAGISHTIYAVLDGERISEKEFKIRSSDAVTIDLRDAEDGAPTEPADASDAALPSSPQTGLPPLAIAGIVVSGVGAGALIAAIVTGIQTKKLDNQLSTDCPGGVCPDAFADDKEKLDTLRKTTNILLISGGAVAATGVTLLIAGLIKKNKQASQAQAVVAPLAGPTAFGLQIQGIF